MFYIYSKTHTEWYILLCNNFYVKFMFVDIISSFIYAHALGFTLYSTFEDFSVTIAFFMFLILFKDYVMIGSSDYTNKSGKNFKAILQQCPDITLLLISNFRIVCKAI